MGEKFLIVGSGGRECAFAMRLAQETVLYAVMGHKNPIIADCVDRSGGRYAVADPGDPGIVSGFAAEHDVDYAFVSADQPLANGVVDALLERGVRTVGATREAARIEWDKIHSIKMMQRVCPENTPFFMTVSDAGQLRGAVSEFESRGLDMVVKPQGLTGGKGVKVMPEHLSAYSDCMDYAASLLAGGDGSVLLVERLDGTEFTVMGITDGRNLVLAPATYDYPFRYEDDRGPGTGGMGCFTGPDGLPFMTDGDVAECRNIMQRIIDEMRNTGLRFSGVLNGGFFKTPDGIRFMEFNARFGDPEVLNILCVLEGSFAGLLERIWDGTLSADSVSFLRKASVVKYMVAEEYPEASSEAVRFAINEDAMSRLGIRTFHASCVRTGAGAYETLKKSRAVAFGAISESIEDASSRINDAIDAHVSGRLEYRRDIGSGKSLDMIRSKAG